MEPLIQSGNKRYFSYSSLLGLYSKLQEQNKAKNGVNKNEVYLAAESLSANC
jgi:hypothetical protein